MKEENKIKLAIIATRLESVQSSGSIKGNSDLVICSQSVLNGLGKSIMLIIVDELKSK